MTFNSLTLEQRKEYKQCNTCFEVKHLTEFWKNKDGDRGTYCKCKECGKNRQDKDIQNKKRRDRYQEQKCKALKKLIPFKV
jgi:uncharacterized Zn finger protein